MKRTEERRLLRRLVIEAAYEEGVTVKRYCEEHDLREYWHRVAGLTTTAHAVPGGMKKFATPKTP